MTGIEPNVIATAGAVATLIGAGLITYLVNRLGKSADARGLAEAALVGIGPVIIEGQNKRIAELTEQVDRLWVRDSECRTELAEAGARILVLEHRAGVIQT